ncbi:unnamed protein product [Sphagnum jensenii]
METKADGEVQLKDLAFAAVASTDDCSNCCCIQRMTDCIPRASSFAEINFLCDDQGGHTASALAEIWQGAYTVGVVSIGIGP